MEYLKKRFWVVFGSKKYRDNYDKIFRIKNTAKPPEKISEKEIVKGLGAEKMKKDDEGRR